MTESSTALEFSGYITERTQEFTGREWVFRAIDSWLADPAARPVFLLTGEPGSGKSAIMARLAQISRGETTVPGCTHLRPGFLAYAHFCQAQQDPTLSPLRHVEALARSLANVYPPFRDALLGMQERDVNIQARVSAGPVAKGGHVTGVVIGALHITGLSAREAFDRTVRRPLEALHAPGFPGRILILVDSLDEALTREEGENIAALLANVFGDADNRPPQVHTILSSRPDEQIESWFGRPSLDLIDDRPWRAHDIQNYAYGRLAAVDEAHRKQMSRRLDRAAQGNFLYARYALDDILSRADVQTLVALPPLPGALPEVYHTFIETHLAASQKRWRQVRPLLGALVVARDSGLTRGQLQGIMDLFKELAPSETDDLLDACTQYLEGTEPSGPFHLYHHSFREFLESSTEYSIYPAEAHRAIGRFFLEVYGSDWLECEDEYALRHTLFHLKTAAIGTGRPEEKLALARVHQEATALEQDEQYKVARIHRLSRGELAPAIEAFVSRKALGFVGRGWVFGHLNAWLGSADSRPFLIVGGRGTGKTALAARLWQISRGLVPINELRFPQLCLGCLTYAHFDQDTGPARWAPLQFLEGLRDMLVYRYKDYARLYVDQVLRRLASPGDHPAADRALAPPKIRLDLRPGSLQQGARVLGEVAGRWLAGDPIGKPEIRQALDRFDIGPGVSVGELVARLGSVQQAVDTLLDPLRRMCADNPHLRVVILLDGAERLFETPLPMEHRLLSLMDRLPEQARLVLLGRPRPEILEMLGPPQVDLDHSTVEGENDVLAYALEQLERRASLPEHQRRSAAEQVARRSEGNFAWARLALDALDQGRRLD